MNIYKYIGLVLIECSTCLLQRLKLVMEASARKWLSHGQEKNHVFDVT